MLPAEPVTATQERHHIPQVVDVVAAQCEQQVVLLDPDRDVEPRLGDAGVDRAHIGGRWHRLLQDEPAVVGGQARNERVEHPAREPVEVRQAVGDEREHALGRERVHLLDPVQRVGELALIVLRWGGAEPGRREQRVDRRERDHDAIDGQGRGRERGQVELGIRQDRGRGLGAVPVRRVDGEPHRHRGEMPHPLQPGERGGEAAPSEQELAAGHVEPGCAGAGIGLRVGVGLVPGPGPIRWHMVCRRSVPAAGFARGGVLRLEPVPGGLTDVPPGVVPAFTVGSPLGTSAFLAAPVFRTRGLDHDGLQEA